MRHRTKFSLHGYVVPGKSAPLASVHSKNCSLSLVRLYSCHRIALPNLLPKTLQRKNQFWVCELMSHGAMLTFFFNKEKPHKSSSISRQWLYSHSELFVRRYTFRPGNFETINGKTWQRLRGADSPTGPDPQQWLRVHIFKQS